MTPNGSGLLPRWIRHTSLATCVVFVYVNVVYGAVEPSKDFWKARKEAAARMNSPSPRSGEGRGEVLLAQLPALDLHALPQAPSVRNLPLPSTSLKPSIQLPDRILPKWINSVSASQVTLKDLYLPPSWKPGDFMVLHIQDAHGNAQAQENIAKTLDSLTKQEKGLLLGIEGARGAFDFHPYRSFPDPEVTKEIADYFIKEGFITGPEYVGMTSQNLPHFSRV